MPKSGALSEQNAYSSEKAFDAFCSKLTNTPSNQSDFEAPLSVKQNLKGDFIESQKSAQSP